MFRHSVVAASVALLLLSAGSIRADVFNMGGTRDLLTGQWTGSASVEFVTVGNAGNAADTTGYGAVGYAYQIGTYDVTVGQYCQFLNAVAKTDSYSLYAPGMAHTLSKDAVGCGITQSGSSGAYVYSVTPGHENFPVTWVCWGDAARFCNWLENGQPTGSEGTSTTETGSYAINGATSTSDLSKVSRSASAKYFIPTESEWYKAAYYKAGGTNSGYWLYPTQSNTAPGNVLPDTGNNANHDFTDPVNYLTPVGAFAKSPGPYGTYDQGGDAWQWNETEYFGTNRGYRGGTYYGYTMAIKSSYWNSGYPINEDGRVGFRVASLAVPEPGSIALLLAGAISLLAYASRRRRKLHNLPSMILAAMVVLAAGSAQADVFNMGGTRNPTTGAWTGQASLEFVPVGNPGNAADTAVMNDGTTGYGSVPYIYQMGKYDVTVGQYCQFLNAVAKTDTYGLYNSPMATNYPFYPTIGIAQSGSSGSYSYSAAGSYSKAANCPIFFVSWGDAARFCNWLQNGQPTGAEGTGTTETGAYTLNGWTDNANLMTVTRNAGATYFIPSENEWYKAAYYKGGGTNAGYWMYPTQSNSAPINTLPDTGNHANFYDSYGTGNSGYTDSTNYLTPVGAFSNSPGAYGTFDMGGDVWQWNETAVAGLLARGMRGSGWSYGSYDMGASFRGGASPAIEYGSIWGLGFRVASVPEPGSIVLALVGGLCLLAYAWRRHRV